MIKVCDVCGEGFDTAMWRLTPDDSEPKERWATNHASVKRCSMSCEQVAKYQRKRQERRLRRLDG